MVKPETFLNINYDMILIILLEYGSRCSIDWRISNCRFARDVTAAMLVIRNKNISLHWELNSIFK